MWEMMSGVASGVRNRLMPRRRSGMGTMTALVIGASVGIAAWEAVKRTQPMSRMTGDSTATEVAQGIIDQIEG